MPRRCACEGAVRFGYGSSWTEWLPVSGYVDCSVNVFGDPYPDHGKVCMCKPTPTVAASECGEGVPLLGSRFVEERDAWALACMLAVALTFFVFHISLGLVRIYNQGSSLYPGILEKVLEASTMSVQVAPMLCVTFIVTLQCAMAMQWDSAGVFSMQQHLASSPIPDNMSGCVRQAVLPDPLRLAIAICAAAFCLQVLLRLNLEWLVLTEPYESRFIGGSHQVRYIRFCESVFHASWVAMYVALAVVLVNIVQQPRVKSKLGPATLCTVVLAVTYFAVYVVLFTLRVGSYRLQPARHITFGIATMKLGTIAVNFAPMMGVLFLGMQFALEWKSMSGNIALPDAPPGYINSSMLMSTGCVLAQVFLVVLAPLAFGAELVFDGHWGEETLVMKDLVGFIITGIMRWLALAIIFASVGMVCCEMWLMRSVVPPVAHVVCFLAGLYFTIYGLLWLVNSARLFCNVGLCTATMLCIVAKETVVLCPMLAALFLGSWACAAVRSVGGAAWRTPQGYGQGYMYIVAFVLLLQLVLVLLLQAKEGPTLNCGLQRGGLAPEELYTAPARRYEGRPRIPPGRTEVTSLYDFADPSVPWLLRAVTGVMA